MAYSSDTYYTWIAQGKGGIQASPITYTTIRYDLSPFNEYTEGLMQSISPIHEWTDYTAYDNDTTTRITLNLSGGNISKLVIQCQGGVLGPWVEVYDLDGNRVPTKEYGI